MSRWAVDLFELLVKNQGAQCHGLNKRFTVRGDIIPFFHNVLLRAAPTLAHKLNKQEGLRFQFVLGNVCFGPI